MFHGKINTVQGSNLVICAARFENFCAPLSLYSGSEWVEHWFYDNWSLSPSVYSELDWFAVDMVFYIPTERLSCPLSLYMCRTSSFGEDSLSDSCGALTHVKYFRHTEIQWSFLWQYLHVEPSAGHCPDFAWPSVGSRPHLLHSSTLTFGLWD